jgi:hypothetical protein
MDRPRGKAVNKEEKSEEDDQGYQERNFSI